MKERIAEEALYFKLHSDEINSEGLENAPTFHNQTALATENSPLKFFKESGLKTRVSDELKNVSLSFFILTGFLLSLPFRRELVSAGYILPITVICLAACLLPAATSAFKALRKPSYHKLVPIILPVIGAAISAVFFKWVKQGLIIFLNSLTHLWGSFSGRITPNYSLPYEGLSADLCVTLFLAVLFLLLSYLLTISVKKGYVFLPLLLISLSVLLTVLNSAAFSETASVFLMSGLFTLSLTSVVLNSKQLKNRRGRITYLKKGKFKAGSGFLTRLFSILISVIMLGGLLASLLVSSLMFREQHAVKTQRKLLNKIDDVRYGNKSVLPDGQLENAVPFPTANISDDIRLKVRMEHPDSYYLRGFVGGQYKNNTWSGLSTSHLYESSDLFYWLHKGGFYGQSQLSSLQNALNSQPLTLNMTLKNVSASSKYIYAPYEVTSLSEKEFPFDYIGDDKLPSAGFTGSRNYTLTVTENQIKQYGEVMSQLYKSYSEYDVSGKLMSYLENEGSYSTFVYQSYLAIPEEVKPLLTSVFGTYPLLKTGETVHASYDLAKESIFDYLTQNFEYSVGMKKFSETDTDRDFIAHFIENKKGYSVHFASAATLMFRYYKIPARYVEGYLITPEDAENAAEGKVEITDKNAHAWTEFYQDGLGWIPFEVTPKYLGVMESDEELGSFDKDGKGLGELPEVPPLPNEDIFENTGETPAAKETGINLNVIAIILLAAAVIALALSAIVLIKRKSKLNRLYLLFNSQNNFSQSSVAIFAFCIRLLSYIKLLKSDNVNGFSISEDGENVTYRKEYNSKLKKAAELYEKARFSNIPLSKDERDSLLAFQTETVSLAKLNRKKRGSFLDRRIKFVYR